MKTILIKNALLLATMDAENREIKNGDVYIEGNVIKKVGAGINLKADETINAEGCVVIPGMINTHHHFYQTLTRNLPKVQDAKLFDWLTYLYDIWKFIDVEAVYASTQTAMGELLLTGCTTTSDHLYLFPHSGSEKFIDTQIEAAKEMGMRAVEICLLCGKPASAVWTKKFFNTLPEEKGLFVFIKWEKEQLRRRIEERTELNFPDWKKETEELLDEGYPEDCRALKILGYPQVIAHIKGTITEREAKDEIVRLSMAYAKRQNTWFSRYKNIMRIELGKEEDYDPAKLAGLIISKL